MVTTKIKLKDHFKVIFSVALCGGFIFTLLLLWLLGDILGVNKNDAGSELAIGTFILASLIYIYHLLKWVRYDTWSFSNGILYRGGSSNLVVPITDIEMIRIGLPELSGVFERMIKFDSEHGYRNRQSKANEAMVLSIKGNKLLPLSVSTLENGKKIQFLVLVYFHLQDLLKDRDVSEFLEFVERSEDEGEIERRFEQLSRSGKFSDYLDALKEKNSLNNPVYTDQEKKILGFGALNKVINL